LRPGDALHGLGLTRMQQVHSSRHPDICYLRLQRLDFVRSCAPIEAEEKIDDPGHMNLHNHLAHGYGNLRNSAAQDIKPRARARGDLSRIECNAKSNTLKVLTVRSRVSGYPQYLRFPKTYGMIIREAIPKRRVLAELKVWKTTL
jgi:hypothetical protein